MFVMNLKSLSVKPTEKKSKRILKTSSVYLTKTALDLYQQTAALGIILDLSQRPWPRAVRRVRSPVG
jgi:hypothetical protein